jgi:predicted RNase H-like nuclease (RuvC/YqgF family)
MLEVRKSRVQDEHEGLLDYSYTTEQYNDRARPLRNEIDRFSADIDNLKAEMDAIEKAMESKWK